MTLKAPSGGCTIRIYRHGLGDCFLLAFGGTNRKQKYMLIDCGVLLGTSKASATMQKVAENIKKATNAHLDVLAITHEHWDHVSGFIQAQEIFKQINIDKVWLAWTEDPNDPLAKELRKKRQIVLKTLQVAVDRLKKTNLAYANKILAITEFFGDHLSAAGRQTTEDAFDWIKTQWKNPLYCRPDMKPIKLKGIPNIRFFILGPPADKKLLRKSRPSKRKSEVYLDEFLFQHFAPLFEGFGPQILRNAKKFYRDDKSEGFLPFNPAYVLKEYPAEMEEIRNKYESASWRQIDDNWVEYAGELALKLDSHTNNTSLVMAIELKANGKVLLFTGDAQVGNWLSWYNVTWKDGDEKITVSDLLSRTVLYKVGHHGSHNATLREQGLEKMTHHELTAIIPVDQKIADKKKWHMPHKPLYERLIELTDGRVILADEGLPDNSDDLTIENLKKRSSQKKLYIDITIQP